MSHKYKIPNCAGSSLVLSISYNQVSAHTHGVIHAWVGIFVLGGMWSSWFCGIISLSCLSWWISNSWVVCGTIGRSKGANDFFVFCSKQRWERPLGTSWWRGTGIRTEGILFTGPQQGSRGSWEVSGPSKSKSSSRQCGLSLYVHVTSRTACVQVLTWKKVSVSKLMTAITHILWHLYVFLLCTCTTFCQDG